jgi:hypothetical protein
MFPLQPIINGWFARHLIPQIELIIVEERNDLDFFIEYREEALINKIRDENDQELKFDPSYIKRRFI